jgi:hypothetical protein
VKSPERAGDRGQSQPPAKKVCGAVTRLTFWFYAFLAGAFFDVLRRCFFCSFGFLFHSIFLKWASALGYRNAAMIFLVACLGKINQNLDALLISFIYGY